MIHMNKEKVFHLNTKSTSYIMQVLPSGHLGHLYYGRGIRVKDNYDHMYQRFSTSLGNSTDYHPSLGHYTLDAHRLELGTSGKGDYKEPSLMIRHADGTMVSDFKYDGHQRLEGKMPLEDLPSSFENGDAVETLVIHLKDQVKGLALDLYYGVFYDKDVITRSMVLRNLSDTPVEVEKIMSMNLDFSGQDFDLITLDGKWIQECQMHRRPVSEGTISVDSKRGVSSSTHNPFLCLVDQTTTEHHGAAYGFALMYSGNHQGLVEQNPHHFTRLQMGINPHQFRWLLEPGDQFVTPEVVMTFSHKGLNGMSHHFHDFINHNVIPKAWQQKSRPVLINNWEATYFDFSEKKLIKLAKEAKNLGVELFVLDDGWFGKRNDDQTSLGDWYENKAKLPGGLEGLSEKIRAMGLDFGLWVEPEMVSQDSDLYRAHPDWVMRTEDRQPSLGRNQMVLDLSNLAVVDHLTQVLKDLFVRSQVSYVKWDMNRNFSDMFSKALPSHRQQELNHRYVLGLYKLMGRLTKALPNILFEACASGGNRFDLGMLAYMPQIWTSDNTDGLERQKIQYGTSLLYPLSTMGAHVSAIPSHQVMRKTPIETRFNVAMFGVLGYELDVTKLSNFDKKVMKQQIAYYKTHRKLLQYGRFTRLTSPYDGNTMTWMVAQDQALLGYYQVLQKPNHGFESLKLMDLDPGVDYIIDSRKQFANVKDFGEMINHVSPIKMKEDGLIHNLVSQNYMFEMNPEHYEAGGDELLYGGLKVNQQFIATGYDDQLRYIGDFGSRVYHIRKSRDQG